MNLSRVSACRVLVDARFIGSTSVLAQGRFEYR
jgi:hypothetical protein